MPPPQPNDGKPVVLIVGGGFGGLGAAKRLKNADAHIALVDRTNHHLFQPLLYQVATATLAPGDIASPIRKVLAKQANAYVVLTEVTGVDPVRKRLLIDYLDEGIQEIPYDYLVLATGARHSYFGRNEFAENAPGLKALSDATSIRGRILKAFELAEMEDSADVLKQLLTFVLVGGGPTGVEMAGAIAELTRYTLRHEFRRVRPAYSRILLVEGSPRILGGFHESLSRKAAERLGRMGVQVMAGRRVQEVGPDYVLIDQERVATRTVIWTAGVEPSPVAKWLGVPADKAGRVMVAPDCSVPGYPEVFVIGDAAHYPQPNGGLLPGVAQVAMQQGRYVAEVIKRKLTGKAVPGPFRYSDRGNMAVVGRNFAILERGNIRLSGYFAWLAWVFIHIAYLAEYDNRFRVLTQWAWTYFTKQGGSRLIVEPAPSIVKHPSPESTIP